MNDRTLLILNGPGLARLSDFASDAFGVTSLEQVQSACEALCVELGVELDFRQTDNPNQMVQWIRDEADSYAALIVNQLGCADPTTIDYAQYVSDLSVLATLSVPVTEIHMTNVLRFDSGKFKALRGPAGKTALICGLGIDSYRLAIRAAAKNVSGSSAK